MHYAVGFVAVRLLLSGCQASQQQIAEMQMPDHLSCTNAGHQSGTPEYNSCRQSTVQSRIAVQQQQAIQMQRIGAALSGAALVAAASQPRPVYPASSGTTCFRSGESRGG